MNALLTDVYGFLASQSMHLALLFFLIWILTALFRRQSAHPRYLLWLVVLAKCLVPSVVSIPMAVLPENVASLEQANVPLFPSEPMDASGNLSEEIASALPTHETVQVESTPSRTAPVASASVDEISAVVSPWSRFSLRQWTVVLWTTGCVLFLGVTILRGFCFGIALRRRRLKADNGLQAQVGGLVNRFWPGRRARAYQLEGINQPFVWGLLHGAVYLPADFAQTGTDSKRNSVLLHEIAHVTRLDPLVNLLQIAVQGLYWFHPLVWIANRMIRSEREKCCDEIALAKLDTTPREYGSAIVDTLVQTYESRLTVPSLAVAGPVKNLEDRIKTIMKPGKRFYSRPSFKALGIILVLAALTAPLTFALTNRGPQYQTTLPNGVTVQLVAVCEYPSQGRHWWHPDGSLVEDLSIVTEERTTHQADDPGYAIVYRSSGNHVARIVSVKGSHTRSGLEVLQPQGLTGVCTHIQKKRTHTDIRIASPSGRWAVAVKAGALGSSYGTVRGNKVILAVGQQGGQGLTVLASDELGYGQATRIIALDKDGREFQGETMSDLGVQGLRQRSIHFSELEPSHLTEIQFQICSYVYHTFRKVSLRPDVKADAKGAFRYETFAEDQNINAKADQYKPQMLISKTSPFNKSQELRFQLESQETNSVEAVLPKYSITLPPGVTVELLAICECPSEGKQWWRPDGTPYAMPIGIKIEDRLSKSHDNAYTFLFRYNSEEELAWNSLDAVALEFTIKGNRNSQLLCFKRLPKDDQHGLLATRAIFKEPLDSTTVQVNLATGPWQTRAVQDIRRIDQRNEDLYWFDTRSASSNRTHLNILHRIEGHQLRTISIDRDGNEYDTSYSMGSIGGHTMSINDLGPRYMAGTTKDAQLAKFKLQSRPYVSSIIGNVSLRRAASTEMDRKTERTELVPAAGAGPRSQNEEGQTARGTDITFHKETSLRDALSVLAKTYRKNIICSEGIKGTVPLTELYDIESFDVALKAILGNNRYVVDDNLIRIYTTEEYQSMGLDRDEDLESASSVESAVSAQDRREIEQLMQDHRRVVFKDDWRKAQAIFHFESGQQRQRFLNLLKAEAQRTTHAQTNEKRPVHVVQIDRVDKNRVVVSVLLPFGKGYVLRSVFCIQASQGWRVDTDTINELEGQLQRQRMDLMQGTLHLVREELAKWVNSQGQKLHEIYANERNDLERQILMLEYAKRQNLQVPEIMSAEGLERQLEYLNARTPEEYRAEMIIKWRRNLPDDRAKLGRLEFRLVPDSVESSRTPGPLTADQEQAYRNHLQEHGPRKPLNEDIRYLWLPLHARTEAPMAVTEAYQGRRYVLVSQQPGQTMIADGSWGLLAVSQTQDRMGRRAIALELDVVGAERFYTLTKDHIDRPVAMVLDGQVLSAPTIKTAIRRKAIITGKFTESEIRNMIFDLQQGMPAQ